MNNKAGNGRADDFVGMGFHRLDEVTLEARPPKISWGNTYQGWSAEKQLLYTQKLACTMNHAAYLITIERDKLNTLCEQKELKLQEMTKALNANNAMIQQQVTEMNEYRQKANAHAANQNKLIKELRNGNNS